MNPLYPLVAQRAGHRCEYCRAPEAIFNLPFEVEHIIPTSRDGSDEESNCALACRSCNLSKSDQVEGLDRVTGEVARLLHPRQDLSGAHFRIDVEAASISGVTPTGRVTVATLQMNRPVQLAARQQWMLLGLFP
jgi:HNH endonuclease